MNSEKERLDQDFIGEEEMMKILGITKGTLYGLRSKTLNPIPFIKIGMKTIFYEADVVEWLKTNTKNPLKQDK